MAEQARGWTALAEDLRSFSSIPGRQLTNLDAKSCNPPASMGPCISVRIPPCRHTCTCIIKNHKNKS